MSDLDNTLATAHTFPISSQIFTWHEFIYFGTVTEHEDLIDYFKFNISSESNFSLFLDGTGLLKDYNLDVRVYNSIGNIITGSTGPTDVESINNILLNPGDYYVTVELADKNWSSYAGSGGVFQSYDLSMSAEPQTVTLPDLTISNINLGSISITKGDNLFFYPTFTNIGNTTANQSIVSVYIDNTFSFSSNLQALGSNAISYPSYNLVTSNLPVGNHTLKVVLDSNSAISESNEANNSYSRDFTVTEALPVNHSPNIYNYLQDQTVNEGSQLNYSIPSNSFVDSDGDTLVFSASLSNGNPLPSWISFNQNTHQFSGTIPYNTSDLSVRVTVTDTGGLSFSDEFLIYTLALETMPSINISTPPGINEGNAGSTNLTFYVTRTGNTNIASNVAFSVSGGTADAADFTGGAFPSGVINFLPGETTSKAINIAIAGDSTVESNEFFNVILSNVSGGTLGIASSTGTILNDDNASPTTSKFNIQLYFAENVPDNYKVIFQNAAEKWESIITEDIPDFGSVDDIAINIKTPYIDGKENVLGKAEFDVKRPVTNLPSWSHINLDSADIDLMIKNNIAESVIFHEMAHALGFGSLWKIDNLANGHNYTGTHALAEYRTISGIVDAGWIPLESDLDAKSNDVHWAENIFDSELMTPVSESSPPMPISRMTIAAFEDLGYVVDYSKADSYEIDPASIISPTTELNAPTYISVSESPTPDSDNLLGSELDDIIFGLEGNDYIYAIDGNDSIDGGMGNDTLAGQAGNDLITGGPGVDTAVFRMSRDQYQIQKDTLSNKIAVNSTSEGNDSLTEIERIKFSDKAIAFDLDENAGSALKILGATFGAPSVLNKQYVGVGLFILDAGWTDEETMQLAIASRLGDSATNQDIVNLLYTNIFGAAPTASEEAYFQGLLDRGEITAAKLGMVAAQTDININNIVDLIGLTELIENGIEYFQV